MFHVFKEHHNLELESGCCSYDQKSAFYIDIANHFHPGLKPSSKQITNLFHSMKTLIEKNHVYENVMSKVEYNFQKCAPHRNTTHTFCRELIASVWYGDTRRRRCTYNSAKT